MKKILLSIGILLCSAAAFAQGTALKLTLTDGTSDTYLLNEKPAITFSGSDMLIATPEISSTYPRADVQSMIFTDSPDSGIEQTGNDTLYIYTNNTFTCEGHQITVYTLSGAVEAIGFGSVSLAGLPKGIYIINVNNKSIKVIR